MAQDLIITPHQEPVVRQVPVDHPVLADQPAVVPNVLQPLVNHQAEVQVAPVAQEQNAHLIAERAKTVKTAPLMVQHRNQLKL